VVGRKRVDTLLSTQRKISKQIFFKENSHLNADIDIGAIEGFIKCF
jgi:hypothetical protein